MVCGPITEQALFFSRLLSFWLAPAPLCDRQQDRPITQTNRNKRTAQLSIRKRKKEGSISSVTVALKYRPSRLIDNLADK